MQSILCGTAWTGALEERWSRVRENLLLTTPPAGNYRMTVQVNTTPTENYHDRKQPRKVVLAAGGKITARQADSERTAWDYREANPVQVMVGVVFDPAIPY